MDALYSTTLLMAVVSVTGAWLGLASRRLAVGWVVPASSWIRRAAWLALLFTAVSALVHFLGGHWRGSPEAQGLLEFLWIHPAFVVTAGLAALALHAQKRVSQRNRR